MHTFDVSLCLPLQSLHRFHFISEQYVPPLTQLREARSIANGALPTNFMWKKFYIRVLSLSDMGTNGAMDLTMTSQSQRTEVKRPPRPPDHNYISDLSQGNQHILCHGGLRLATLQLLYSLRRRYLHPNMPHRPAARGHHWKTRNSHDNIFSCINLWNTRRSIVSSVKCNYRIIRKKSSESTVNRHSNS